MQQLWATPWHSCQGCMEQGNIVLQTEINAKAQGKPDRVLQITAALPAIRGGYSNCQSTTWYPLSCSERNNKSERGREQTRAGIGSSKCSDWGDSSSSSSGLAIRSVPVLSFQHNQAKEISYKCQHGSFLITVPAL